MRLGGKKDNSQRKVSQFFDYFCYCFYAFRIFVDFMLLYILIMRQMDDKHK